MQEDTFDYIVVGSGAGGGPLACNLVKHGFKVGVVEAGRDPAVRDDATPNYNYSIPALHGLATEDPSMSWGFFVNHYSDPGRQKQNPKFVDPGKQGGVANPLRTGIFYPRAGTLGGCTAHNAMITIYPHNEDWDRLAELTNDNSWAAENMRQYFERMEHCTYAPETPNEGRHGFGGWLHTSLADPFIIAGDQQLVTIAVVAVKAYLRRLAASLKGLDEGEKLQRILESVDLQLQMAEALQPKLSPPLRSALAAAIKKVQSIKQRLSSLLPGDAVSRAMDPSGDAGSSSDDAVEQLLHSLELDQIAPILVRYLDPNDWRVAEKSLEGVYAVPLATDGIARRGTREHLLNVQAQFPNRLFLLTDSLAVKVLFDGDRATGVQIVEGAYLYRASPRAVADAPLPGGAAVRNLTARREVILCGGTFNTPQLLMLSGIGPQKVLDQKGVKPLLGQYWEGVGKNLHDRYEVAVIGEMADDFQLFSRCSFKTPEGENDADPCFIQWKNRGSGAYTTNGVLISVILKSKAATTKAPDLFIFGLPGYFPGYHPQYSEQLTATPNSFTWAILKGHTTNRAGEVVLRSADPRDPPEINFNYFDENSGHRDQDLDAVAEGIRFASEMMTGTGKLKRRVLPDPSLQDDGKLRDFIVNQAWGHHACGTCKIGPSKEEGAVIDSRFQVHGLRSLRVVDASVFPDIPGFFIVTPIYMISEKASDVIIADAS